MKPVFLIIMLLGPGTCQATAPTPVTPQPVPASTFADLINAERTRQDLRPVRLDSRLALAAARHAQDMTQNNYLSHRSLSGARLSDRVARTGYCTRGLAENIAFGQRSATAVYSMWFNSPDHRRNMMRPSAVAYGLAESDGTWVLVLGDAC